MTSAHLAGTAREPDRLVTPPTPRRLVAAATRLDTETIAVLLSSAIGTLGIERAWQQCWRRLSR